MTPLSTCAQLVTGNIPYHELRNDAQVIAKLLQGQTLPQPENNAHPELWLLMVDCWNRDLQARPSIDQAVERMEHMVTSTSSDAGSTTDPWAFQWTHDVITMPQKRDRQATVRDSSVTLNSSLLAPGSNALVGRRTGIPAQVMDRGEDGVEDFAQILDQLNDRATWTFVSPVPSLNSSIELDEFSYSQDDPQGTSIHLSATKLFPLTSTPLFAEGSTSRWYYGSPMTTSASDYVIAFGSQDGFVRVWTMRTDSFDCQSFRSSTYGVVSLGLSPAGQVVTSGNMYDPVTRLWDLQTSMAIAQDSSASSNMRTKQVLFSSDGSFMIKLGNDHTEATFLEVWDMMPPRMLAQSIVPEEDPPVRLMALSSNDQILVTVDRQCDVRGYRLVNTGLIPFVKHTPHLDWQIEGVAFCDSWTIRLLHLEWWSHTLQCATMDLKTGFSTIVQLRNPAANSWRLPQVTCTAFSRNGNRVAVGFQGGHVQVYHAADGRAIGRLLEHHGGRPGRPAVTSISFSVTSDCLFTTDAAGYCWLWHVPSTRAVIAFTPDGGVEHQDVTVLTKFRGMVADWRRQQQQGRRDSEDTIITGSLDA